ncbi:MAG TPA: zinc ribbon domain-containing protein [Paraburkholderia sp.]|nr:zinc ribbon domain-containing protein [Paraburkholderia sp.]
MLGSHRGGGHHGAGWNRGERNSHHASRSDTGGYRTGKPLPSSTADDACPKCRAFGAPDDRFCQQCDSGLVPVACSTCRAEIRIGARFCQQCGTAVSALA